MADTVVVTDAGMAIITAQVMDAAGSTIPKYVGWGTGGSVAAASTDIALNSTRGEARTDGTPTQQTTNVTNDTYQVVATITCTGTSAAIDEVGISDAATAGNLFLRGTFTAIPLNVNDSIQFTIKTVFDQA